ncbi:MAG: hypothetical protein ACFFEN_16040 [Candidatus Thorarchaeota archaeon]
MIDSLYTIFENLELSWIDTSHEILESEYYESLLKIFPNLAVVFNNGRKKDEEEFLRTIRHIFRVFKIYFLIKDGHFSHDTLSEESLHSIREKLINQHSQNELLVPVILMYHDIGRLDNKKEHPYYSYRLISKNNMLESFKLTKIEKLLINKVIQYHLLFATIYTGESTFYGIYSLLNDTEFDKLLAKKENVNRFIDLLEIFTYIDILGYFYSRIYDHYVVYYDEINKKLKTIFSFYPNKEKALDKATEYSHEWIEWRIAGALRIFQYINTEPYLTKDFYFNKIKDSVNEEILELYNVQSWEDIKKTYLINTSKIQMKYGLAVLMLLAFCNFFRGPINTEQEVSNKLILFWILLSEEIKKRSKEKDSYLWNIHFIGLPNWGNWNRKFKTELNFESLNYIIKNSTQEFDDRKKEFNLYLDLNLIF